MAVSVRTKIAFIFKQSIHFFVVVSYLFMRKHACFLKKTKQIRSVLIAFIPIQC